jgi:2-methylisocitrate lyase-like PEP mutase family enzyme
METETIDKLFLELSQVTRAKTAREIELEKHLAFVQAQRDSLLNGTAPNTHQVTLSDEAIRRAILCDSHPVDGFYIAFLNEAEMLRAGRRIAKMAAEIAESS